MNTDEALRLAAHARTTSEFDGLAHWVADRLDGDDPGAAWRAVQVLERRCSPRPTAEPAPPSPVIGRRFAAAYRRITSERCSDRVAA